MPAETVNRIKREVTIELELELLIDKPQAVGAMDNMSETPELDMFERIHLKNNGISPLAKPRLPNVIFRAETNETINKVNNIIP